MRTSALFGAKNIGFFKIYGVSARTRGGGFNQCGHFADKGGGQFFEIFADVFYGRPLIIIIFSNKINLDSRLGNLRNCKLVFLGEQILRNVNALNGSLTLQHCVILGPVYTCRTLTGVKLNNN